jgi:hypothetical protein
VPLEVLNLTFVFCRSGTGFESAEISAPLRFRVDFARVQPIFAARELADHGFVPPFGAISEYFISSRVPNVDHSQRNA